MVLKKIGEYLTTINVNGTERVSQLQNSDETYNISEIFNTDIVVNGTNEGSFNQQEDSTYDISVSAQSDFQRKDIVVFWVGGDDGLDSSSWDVLNGSGDVIDTVTVQIPSGSGGSAVRKVYTDQGDVSFSKRFSVGAGSDDGIERTVVEPTVTATTESVSKQ